LTSTLRIGPVRLPEWLCLTAASPSKVRKCRSPTGDTQSSASVALPPSSFARVPSAFCCAVTGQRKELLLSPLFLENTLFHADNPDFFFSGCLCLDGSGAARGGCVGLGVPVPRASRGCAGKPRGPPRRGWRCPCGWNSCSGLGWPPVRTPSPFSMCPEGLGPCGHFGNARGIGAARALAWAALGSGNALSPTRRG